MAGINKKGNTAVIQNQKVESLVDFRSLSKYKSNKVITKNLTSYIAGCDPNISRLITFCLFESDNSNVLHFTTETLKRYNKYVSMVTDKFGVKQRRSITDCREDLKHIISIGLLIPIGNKMFLINPALCCENYAEQIKFMINYQFVYEKYRIGGVSKSKLNEAIVFLAKKYYNNCKLNGI